MPEFDDKIWAPRERRSTVERLPFQHLALESRHRHVSVKALVTTFKAVGGERVAEWHQIQRSTERISNFEQRGVVAARLSETAYYKVQAKSGFSRRIEVLEAENSSLRQRLGFVAQIVQRRSAAASEASQTPRLPSPTIDKVSQLLATISDDEAALVFELLESGRLPIKKVVSKVGSSRAHSLSNKLGWSETAYCDGDDLVATQLGKAVCQTIVDLTK